ncbi:MAG: hypothetical protein JSW28_10295 [Thermoplasmata archaeon]|nr:MAG: hypothetical protein JSW28_10295 [Thermoplasmata archaeon]
MSGERRIRIAGILALFFACAVLIIASGAAAEGGNETEDQLLNDFNVNQSYNVSLDYGFNATVIGLNANTMNVADSYTVETAGGAPPSNNYTKDDDVGN